jgi:hypothetical protein
MYLGYEYLNLTIDCQLPENLKRPNLQLLRYVFYFLAPLRDADPCNQA